MVNVAELAAAIQELLGPTADRLAKETRCVQRERAFTGSRLVQALVFGWLDTPDSTLSELAGAAATAGAGVSRQAIHRRFTPETAAFLYAVLCEAVKLVFVSEPVAIELLERFTGVHVHDGSVVALPPELGAIWRGCGGSKGANSAFKLGVRLDLVRGELRVCFLNGRSHDRRLEVQSLPLPTGAIRLADLGFFDLDVFARIHQEGAYFLSRVQANTVVCDARGNRTSIRQLLVDERLQDGKIADIRILLGATHRLPVRLIAQRVPDAVCLERKEKLEASARKRGQPVSATRLQWAEWTIYVTNASPQMLSGQEALVLARARWQIEQVFRLWKTEAQIDKSVSEKPYRRLCELYAKVIGVIVQHWMMLTGCWAYPDRSLIKMARIVRHHAMSLAAALARDDASGLAGAIQVLSRSLRGGACKMDKRKQKPRTPQLLLNPSLAVLS